MRGTIIRIMRMRTANCWDGPSKAVRNLPLMLSSQASCVIVSGFSAALDLDTYPLSNFSFVHCALNGLNAVEVIQCSLCILAFSLVFTPYLSNAVVSAKLPVYFSCPCSTEAVGIAHKPPRSL